MRALPLKIKLIYPVYFTAIFVIVFLLHTAFFSKNYGNFSGDMVVKITKGDNLRSVAEKLENSQVIFNKYIFTGLGRIFGYQDKLIPGEYKFTNGLTYLSILKIITDPFVVRSVTVTIPEGLTIRQMGRLLQRQIGIDSARFVEEAKNDSLISLLYLDKADTVANLEGFLFPDTYKLPLSSGMNREKEIINILAAEFRKKLSPEIREKMRSKKLTLVQLLTIASIIEAETRYEPEKKTIAGVYYNRLKKGMKLEADPTVQYILPDGPKKRLLYSDLKYPSPYNTYIHKGLPPGPINNPGMSSIIAALEPENHKYIFFVAKGDGSHRFAESYDEHKKNIELYQQYLKERENKNTQ